MTQALIVGAGSIGSRHAEVLRDLGHDVAFVSSRTDLSGPVYRSVSSGLESFHPGGAATAGRAASAFGVPIMVSSVTHPGLEEAVQVLDTMMPREPAGKEDLELLESHLKAALQDVEARKAKLPKK